ncbi:DinB family protein [Paenibacillus methanolicus]|uniref:DinB family protein n=1 Tax=Paenibacillus methanolicus TaxID=582686 RepID=A0A5S5C538_9BACL|nr:DinB family protein [Paenibacillus methanolicus]TYP73083.1 DinB family protein [Paenibacillus methanolicus]
MNHPVVSQLIMARGWSLDIAELCPADLADVQLDAFPNTIRWQLGHILVVAERMLFSFAPHSSSLPFAFTGWFDSGTKPSDWRTRPPMMEELIALSRRQCERFLAIAPQQFDVRLDPPHFGFASYGECGGFVVVHESFHAGKMDEMLRVIKQNR